MPDDQLKVFLGLAPNYIGWNRYLIVLQDELGNPISDAERVRIRFYLPRIEMRTDWRITIPAENGLYVTSGQDLVLTGEWQIEVDIRQIDRPDARLSLTWAMEAVPNVLVDPAKPRAANYGALTILGLTCLGVIIRLGKNRSRFKPRRSNSGG